VSVGWFGANGTIALAVAALTVLRLLASESLDDVDWEEIWADHFRRRITKKSERMEKDKQKKKQTKEKKYRQKSNDKMRKFRDKEIH
jgi:hypothetical protein